MAFSLKSLAKSVYSGVNAIGSAIGGAVKSVGSALTKPLASSGSGQIAGVAASTPTSTSSSSLGSTLSPVSLKSFTPNAPLYTPISTTSSSLQQIVNRNSGTTGANITYTPINSYGGTTPVTLSSGQNQNSSFSSISGTNSNFSVNSGILSGGGTNPTMPSAPSVSNVGTVNNAGVASMIGDKKVMVNGQFVDKPVDPAQAELDKTRQDMRDMIDGMPRKDSVLDSPEVRAQNEILRQQQQQLNNDTAQLNAITARQQQDLITQRDAISAAGGTSAAWSGRETMINHEAAIAALPIQAKIAADQGNVQLAQDYLKQVTAMKKELIDNEYDYNITKFKAVYENLSAAEKRQMDKMATNETRAYETANNNLERMDSWAKFAAENGYSTKIGQIHALNVGDPNFATKLAAITDGMVKKDSIQIGENPQLYTGLSSGTATAVRSIVSKYGSEPTIQNFATIQDGYNFSKALDTKTTNPADDQALVYSLAKALDPGSVVREGEYATAQKYSQSWITAYGKGVEQALAGTGFLSETARTNIKKTIEQKYNSAKVGYEKQYNEFAGQINNLTGRSDGTKFIRSYITDTQTPINAKQKVDDYIKANPSEATKIATLYSTGKYTDEDIAEYLNQ